MHVIATAGHVDHGKSTLIEALTGTHPDRLKEEQAREMTIDLGFGWLTLPDGQEVGIVDVPGHRDFVENMLAGISGIDAALLVIAADEGVMPQTKEHLAILDLLQIRTGIIVLTKADLIADAEWFAAVESDVRAAVAGTVLQGSPIVRVSARSRSGLGELLALLAQVLGRQPDRVDLGRPRLPIDRVFTMEGFGTVVTGTLSDGHLTAGDEIQFLPSGLRGRVRGLQTHRRKVDQAVPGSRTAVNVSGASADRLRRGEVLIHPGQYQATRRIDARLRLLPDAMSGLVHNREVKVFAGTSETTATLRLLGTDELNPGQQGWIQLELNHPLVCVRGDAFVIRRPSPPETLGGGIIVDPHPARRHKRFDAEVLASLGALADGNPADVLFGAALAARAAPLREIVMRSQLAAEAAQSALQDLIRAGSLVLLEEGQVTIDSNTLAMALPDWSALHGRAGQIVSAYHARFPLRGGIPREELKSQLEIPPRLFNAVMRQLVSRGTLIELGNSVAEPEHRIHFDEREQATANALLRRFEQNPFNPPGLKECRAAAGEEIVSALIALSQLVAVSGDVVFRKGDYDSMVASVRGILSAKGQITLGELRDAFHTSRKYAQAVLEHLDAIGVTRRSGDARVLAG